MLYRAISWCARRALHWCYRDAHVVGQIPATGPVLLAVNHPNDLPDICAVLTFAGRRVTFVANVSATESRVVAWAYGQMGVIPVHRVRDARRAKARGEDSALANAQAFDRVRSVLAAGGCVCVFPEGGVQRGAHLAPLRTGLARMALDARDGAGVRGLSIVPLGLTYESPYHARSRLVATVGQLIELDTWQADDSRPPEPQLTNEIATRLRTVTRNAPDESSARLLRAMASAIAATSSGAEPLLDGTRAWQRYAEDVFGPGISPLPDDDARMAPVRALVAEVERIGAEVPLERLLLASHAERVQRRSNAWWRAPLAWCGLLLHAPAWWLIARKADKSATKMEEIIPRRIVPGVYFAALWYLLLFVGVVAVLRGSGVTTWLCLAWAAALLAVAPRLGTAAMQWQDRQQDRLWASVIRARAPDMDRLITAAAQNISRENPRTTVVS